jgi:hypothetical protein
MSDFEIHPVGTAKKLEELEKLRELEDFEGIEKDSE